MSKFDSNTESVHSDSTTLMPFCVSQTKETPLFNPQQHFAQMAAESLRLRAELEATPQSPAVQPVPKPTNKKLEQVLNQAQIKIQAQQLEKLAQIPTPLEEMPPSHYPQPIPNPRALSTRSKAQLEETERRRVEWDVLEQQHKQAGPAAVGSKIIANITAQLEGQTPTPISEADREMEAAFAQMSLFMDSPQVAQLDLGFHWKRAIHMLEPVKTLLGTVYLPTAFVLSLASSVGRTPEELERLRQYTGYKGQHPQGEAKPDILERPDSEFFVAMWELAGMCGITADYLRKIFHFHSATLRRIFHHHDLKNKTTFTGEEKVLIVGCVFRVRWPVGGAEQYTPEMLEKGRKTQTVYHSLTNRNRVYRDLDADVFNKHTQAAYRKAGKLISNAPGKAKNLTLEAEFPKGFSLELFTFCAGRIRGLTSTNVSDIERFGSQVTRINALCNLLEQPLEKGHNRMQTRVWAVADMLCQTLEGSVEQYRNTWLKVCWTLYRTNKIVWLYQAVWDVLIRAGDLGTIRSQGALIMHLLNQRGYAELRATLEAQHPEEIAA